MQILAKKTFKQCSYNTYANLALTQLLTHKDSCKTSLVSVCVHPCIKYAHFSRSKHLNLRTLSK